VDWKWNYSKFGLNTVYNKESGWPVKFSGNIWKKVRVGW